ncbi:MAG: hypothetical protein GY820_21395 [Gammaproteobacteria bacterium]|nr:hypothetical protein [Gammaproteobacteria bacterium]
MRPPKEIFVEENPDEEIDEGILDDNEFALVSTLYAVRAVTRQSWKMQMQATMN